MLKLTNSNFLALIDKELGQITSKTFTALNQRITSKMLLDFANELDTSELANGALTLEAKSLEAWAAIDSHNWSAYTSALIQNKIYILKYLARAAN